MTFRGITFHGINLGTEIAILKCLSLFAKGHKSSIHLISHSFRQTHSPSFPTANVGFVVEVCRRDVHNSPNWFAGPGWTKQRPAKGCSASQPAQNTFFRCQVRPEAIHSSCSSKGLAQRGFSYQGACCGR